VIFDNFKEFVNINTNYIEGDFTILQTPIKIDFELPPIIKEVEIDFLSKTIKKNEPIDRFSVPDFEIYKRPTINPEDVVNYVQFKVTTYTRINH
jgi:hypothetical protein